MTPYRTLRGRRLALMLLLVTAAGANARPGRGDSGQHQILQARYGIADRHVDVNDRA